MEPELKKLSIKNFLKKAEKSTIACDVLYERRLYEDTLSKTYYVYLYFTKALLISKGIIVKSHKAAGSQFSLHFVKQGIIDKKYFIYFTKLLGKRLKVDYEETFVVNKFLVEEAINMVNEFRKEVYRILNINTIG